MKHAAPADEPRKAVERLRLATRALHQTLEARIFHGGTLDRNGYPQFLLASLPSAAIEIALEDAGIRHLLPDWERRRRRFALARDLAVLGVAEPPSARCAIGFERAELLGWAYVLEGSRLGGKVVLRDLMAGGRLPPSRGDRIPAPWCGPGPLEQFQTGAFGDRRQWR